MILSAAPLLLATSALAQQDNGSTPIFSLPPNPVPQTENSRRQGPELDIFRAPAATPAAPAMPPPAVAPTVPATPVPTRPSANSQPAPSTQGTRPTRAERPPAQPDEDAISTVAVPQKPAEPAAPERSELADPAAASNASTPAPADSPALTAPSSSWPWPWIWGGLAMFAALSIAVFLLRRRHNAASASPQDILDTISPAPVQPSPWPPAAPSPAAPATAALSADHPSIDMTLDIPAARYSLMGVTIGYTLHLHNRSSQAAEDILIRGMIGNARDEQQALLQRFLDGESGMPLHSVVSIAPGATARLAGELRLNPDQIVPVQMKDRALLIPLAAFDAHYRWIDGEGMPHDSGRSAHAFIIGQEQEPPADRLSPLRLDQGPRQYRRTAARAAGQLPTA